MRLALSGRIFSVFSDNFLLTISSHNDMIFERIKGLDGEDLMRGISQRIGGRCKP